MANYLSIFKMESLLVLNIPKLKEKALSKERKPNGTLKTTVIRARKIIAILERDGYKCIQCGSTTNLTIDHPDGRKFAKWDNQQKYKLDKCNTLCMKCHLIKNAKEKIGIK